MKKILLALCLVLLPAFIFPGRNKAAYNEVVYTEKLLNKIKDLFSAEVTIHKHIPSLATFATAQLPEKYDPRVMTSTWQNQRDLLNQNAPVPQEKNAFWYAYLTGNKRLSSLTPVTSSPEIKRTIEDHGQLTPKKSTQKDELQKKIDHLNSALSIMHDLIKSSSCKQ